MLRRRAEQGEWLGGHAGGSRGGGGGGAVPCRREGGSGSSLLAQRPRGGDGAGPGEDVREELRVSGQKERRVQRPPRPGMCLVNSRNSQEAVELARSEPGERRRS